MRGKKWSMVFGAMVLLILMMTSVQAKAAWVTLNEDGDRQYTNESGEILKDQWIGDYHVNSDGLMDRNRFLTKRINGKNQQVFVGNDGKIIVNFKKGFYKIGNYYYYYTKKGKMYRNRWIRSGKKYYYVDEFGHRATGVTEIGDDVYFFGRDGVRQSGWQTVGENKYYFLGSTGKGITNQIYKFSSTKKSYGFDSDGVMVTGWYEFNDHSYYFADNMKTGWLTLGGKKYYLIKSSSKKGQRAEGIYAIGGKLYYFDTTTGEMLKDTTVEHNGRRYIVDKSGICTLIPDTESPSAGMLFFLKFESGSEAYNQTGGDNGNACGAYQFDNRYALLPFVKYAYAENPSACVEFKKFAAYTDGTLLKSNKKFYKAWRAIYKRNPKTFSALQDAYAKINYYDNVERKLFESGIDLSSRSEIVKGAVYSYSIQHGQSAAVAAVKAIKVKSSMSDANLIKKLYKKRIQNFPAYSPRYTVEMTLALSLLQK
ncbi:MAG: hypothetical protein Q4B57_04205 [Eubacteriales bacterium]|nr:hypothetical protein [Eubacteriales bacterium]